MAHNFDVDFSRNWLKCAIPHADKQKKCHNFSIKLEETSTPTSVHLVPGKVIKIPWLYGPAVRLDRKSVIYPCTRYRCSVPCPCLLCRGKYARCSVPNTQPCDCADCTGHFLTHQSFHGIFHFGCKSCSQLIDIFPCLNFNIFHNIEKIEWPGVKGCVVDEFPLHHTFQHVQDKQRNSDFLFNGGWKRALYNWKNDIDDGRFWCKYCNTLFWSFKELTDHIKLRHAASKLFRHYYQNSTGETPAGFKCDECSTSYSSSTYLRRHMETVHYQETYDCERCDVAFTRIDSLKRHQKFDANCAEEKDYFSCAICDYEYDYNGGDDDPLFGRKDSLLRHMRRAHKDSGDQVHFECEFCKQEFSTRYNLTRHKRNHIDPSKGEILACEFCDLEFLKKKDLAKHVRVHSDSKFTCKDCGKQFSRIDNLTKHKKAVHQSDSSKLVCKKCDSNFTAKTNLQRHEQGFYNSDGLARNKCNYCEEEFCTSKLLRNHINSNHQDFSCEQCGQKLTLNSSLDRHIESKRDVSCEECGKCLCNASSLKTHAKEVHYSECDQCGQRFRQKFLKMHKQSVHKHSNE